MGKQDNIEELFRDRFENFEADVSNGLWENINNEIQSQQASSESADSNFESGLREKFDAFQPQVNPGVWNSIQSQIATQVAATSTGSALSAGMSWMIGIVSSVVIAGGVYFYSTSDTDDTQQLTEANLNLTEANEIVEQKKEDKVLSKVLENDSKTIVEPKLEEQQNPVVNTVEKATDNSAFAESNAISVTKETSTDLVGNEVEVESIQEKEAVLLNESNENLVANTIPESDESSYSSENIIDASSLSGEAPLTVNFDVLRPCKAVKWNFADQETSTEFQSAYTFEQAGTYTVNLTYQEEGKSPSMKSVIIKVEEPALVEDDDETQTSVLSCDVNIFTPNDDGMNDFFSVHTENIKDFELIITNVSGAEVFRSNDPKAQWNGTELDGGRAPVGTYFYIATGFDRDGNALEPIKSSIRLNR